MPADHQQQMIAAGWALVRAGNPRGATNHFRAALAENPQNTGALIGLSQAQYNIGQVGAGLSTAEGLLRLAPNMSVAHRLRADGLRRQRRLTEALASAEHAVSLAPREPLGYHVLALIHAARKRHKAAIATCEEGLAIAPADPILMAQRADSVLELRGAAVAEPPAEEALRLSPDQPYVKRIAAKIALARGQVERARDLLSSVLRRDAQNEAAMSLFLLTEPKRHRLLRWLYMFRYWRAGQGWLGWLAFSVAVALIVLPLMAIALATKVPGIVLGLLIRLFMKHRYDEHRKEIKAHFTRFALKPDY